MNKRILTICFVLISAQIQGPLALCHFNTSFERNSSNQFVKDSSTIECFKNLTNSSVEYKVSRPLNVNLGDTSFLYRYIYDVSCSDLSNFYKPNIEKESMELLLTWFDDSSRDWLANLIFYSISEQNIIGELDPFIYGDDPWVEWRTIQKREDVKRWTSFVSNM
jgi:hypothetical protein